MYSIYVTNKTGNCVYIRLQNEKLSAANPSFCYEIDRARGNQGTGNVTSNFVQWGFCRIEPSQTLPFAVDLTRDRMYASLCTIHDPVVVDYEVNFSKYGCVFVSHSPNLHLRQANPKPVWAPAKNGDALKSKIVKASPQTCFGRRSEDNSTPCQVPIFSTDHILYTWDSMDGSSLSSSGELLIDSGHEFLRAKAGDPVPPNTVITGVAEPEGSLFLGRVGGKFPCSISTESGCIKYFCYAGSKKVQSGEILVLTNDPNIA